MKATRDIGPALLDNAHLFDNDFFRRFRLRHAQAPLRLDDAVSKDYLFPTFYGDVTCAMGIFLCSYKKAAALTPHPAIKPVAMPGGRAITAFSCYIYKQVLGVAPYNEIAMTIPVMVDPGVNIPVLPMLLPVFKNFGYYVYSMPVTSLENQIRGQRIWGLPKVVQDIDISIDGDRCVTTAWEENGSEYFRLSIPTRGQAQFFDVSSYLYTRLDNHFLRSETNFRATFNIVKNLALLLRRGGVPDPAVLGVGSTASGEMLHNLEIDPEPFQTRFAVGMSSCFDLPERGYHCPAVSFA